VKNILISLKSSVIQVSIGQISSSFLKVALAPNSSRVFTIRKFWLATAKCMAVFPKESLEFTFAPYLNMILVFSNLLDNTAKCKGVALSTSLQI
jgi:hypothetical protein